MARRAHRHRLIVLIYAVLAALMTTSWFLDRWRGSGLWVVLFPAFIVSFFIFGGFVGTGLLKPFGVKMREAYPDYWRMRSLHLKSGSSARELPEFLEDERERHQRDHAHYRAYWFMGGLILAMLTFWVVPPISVDQMHLSVEQLMDLLHGLYLVTTILVLTLPQSILLWTEPDMEESQN